MVIENTLYTDCYDLINHNKNPDQYIYPVAHLLNQIIKHLVAQRNRNIKFSWKTPLKNKTKSFQFTGYQLGNDNLMDS